MPNWHWNRLTVVVDDARLGSQILDNLNDYGMTYFVPMPKYLVDPALEDMEGITPRWLDWAYTNWGTKWDIAEENRTLLEDNGIEFFEFMTANNGIEPFVDFLREKFPTVTWKLEYQSYAAPDTKLWTY